MDVIAEYEEAEGKGYLGGAEGGNEEGETLEAAAGGDGRADGGR